MMVSQIYFAGGTFWYGVGIISSLFFRKEMFLACCWGLFLMFLGARGNRRGNKKSKCKDCNIEEEW